MLHKFSRNSSAARLGIFLLLAFTLHLLIFLLVDIDPLPPESDIPTDSIIVTIEPLKSARKLTIKQPKNVIQEDNQGQEDSAHSRPKEDMWSKSFTTLHKLLQQPEFQQQLESTQPSTQHYSTNIFEARSMRNSVEIEAYKQGVSEETVVIFRYPSGKKVCVRARPPDPLIPFDEGSWYVMLNGC